MTKKERTKEKIRAAAYSCVARFGFEKTTLEDISKEVGLNKASLYYYYKNKEDIFLEITTDATRQFLEALKKSTLDITGGIEAQVRHFLVERAAYYLKIADDIHISEASLRQVEHLFHEQIRDLEAQERQFLADRITSAMEAGILEKTNALQLATHLILLSEGVKKMAKDRQMSLRDTAQVIADIAENLDFSLAIVFKGLRK